MKRGLTQELKETAARNYEQVIWKRWRTKLDELRHLQSKYMKAIRIFQASVLRRAIRSWQVASKDQSTERVAKVLQNKDNFPFPLSIRSYSFFFTIYSFVNRASTSLENRLWPKESIPEPWLSEHSPIGVR